MKYLRILLTFFEKYNIIKLEKILVFKGWLA